MLYIIVFMFSAAIGSFLNVVIYRLPIMLKKQWHHDCLEYLKQPDNGAKETFNLMLPRSQCPKCHKKISAWNNIPLLSYLLLKARCVNCHEKISYRYPLIELATALLSCFIIAHFGLTLMAACALLFTWILIVGIFIDIDHQLLPDQLTLGLMWLGLLVNCFNLICSPTDAIFGALAGYVCLWLLMQSYRLLTGKIGMGHGDFKLLAALGAWLGWQSLPLIIFIAAFLGSIIGLSLIGIKKHQRNQPMAFGPYLAIAGWICLIWGQNIMQWYSSIAGLN